MPGEARRAVRRIGANYVRLGSNFLLGVIQVPILIAWLGDEAFGLLALIGSSVGLATIVTEILERSMVRELGAAYHARHQDRFLAVYNSAFVLSLIAASAVAIGGALILFAVPLFNISPELFGAARWVVAAETAYMATLTALAPLMNMFQVTERWGVYNAVVIVQRSAYVIPAVALYFALGSGVDPARGLTLYAIWCGVINLAAVILPAAMLAALDRRLVPRPARASRATCREMTGTVSAITLVVGAVSSQERLAALVGNVLMPAAGALGWNAVFAVAQRAVGYVRMAAEGLTRGLDAVSARISAGDDALDPMRRLTRHMTRLNAVVAAPAAVAMCFLAEPLITFWVGRALPDPGASVPRAVAMTRVMVFGLAARSISDGWLSILYGAGHVRRVAPVFVAGGMLTPMAAAGLLLALPSPANELGPSIAVVASMVLVQFLLLAVPASRCLGVRTRDLLGPVLGSAIASVVACPVLVAAAAAPGPWTVWRLLWAGGGYAASYAVAAWCIAVPKEDRRRLVAAVRARLRGPDPAGSPAR